MSQSPQAAKLSPRNLAARPQAGSPRSLLKLAKEPEKISARTIFCKRSFFHCIWYNYKGREVIIIYLSNESLIEVLKRKNYENTRDGSRYTQRAIAGNS